MQQAAPRTRASRRRDRLAAILGTVALAATLVGAPSSTFADEYDPQRAGHPVRIAAYVLHPVGVILDVLIFRPAHWLGSQPGLDEFFGHEPYDD
jgi:hypothetical protein